MAEKEEFKKGKALSGLSAALIVYSLAGGSISGSGNLLGTAVSVENPAVIEWAIFVLLLYLAYRYWMALSNPLNELDKTSIISVQHNKYFRKYIKKISVEKVKEFRTLDNKYKHATSAILYSYGGNPEQRIKKNKNGFYCFQFRFYNSNQSYGTEEYKLDKWRFILYGFYTIFYKEDFWVIIMPWILFFTALFLLVLSLLGIDVFIPSSPRNVFT